MLVARMFTNIICLNLRSVGFRCESVKKKFVLNEKGLKFINSNRFIITCAIFTSSQINFVCLQLLQYSKFNNPDSVVRDVTSTAQAICVDDLVSGYYDHANVTLFLTVAIILPISSAVAGTLTLLCNYQRIQKKAQDDSQRPQIIGAVVTGIYVVLYILSSDILAVIHYVEKWDEYRFNDALHHTFQLQITWITLVTECLLSFLALLCSLCFIIHKDEQKFRHKWYHIVTYPLSLLRSHIYPVLFILGMPLLATGTCAYLFYIPFIRIAHRVIIIVIISSSALFLAILLCFFWLSKGHIKHFISFLVVPVVFVSAHIDYILVAWLTEPSKTTSVSILALSIILYLFILSHLVYEKVQRKLKDLRALLLITIAIVFPGILLVALHVLSFYILPIPAIQLTDYLDNIFQISIVIFAALISYKVFSHEDSEAKKFFKKFNETFASRNTKPSQKQELPTHSVLTKESRLCVNLTWNNEDVKVNEAEMNRKNITVKLKETALILQFIGHNNTKKYIKLLAEDVTLNLGSISQNKNQVNFPLSKAKLAFKYLSPFRNEQVTVALTEASIGRELIPASEYMLHIDSKGSNTAVWLITNPLSCISKDINIDCLEIPLQCYSSKTVPSNQGGVYCQLAHVISLSDETTCPPQKIISAWIDEKIEQLLVPYSSVTIKVNCDGNSKYFQINGKTEIVKEQLARNAKIRLMKQFVELRYSIKINAGEFEITKSDDNTRLIVKYSGHSLLSVPTSAKFTTVKLVTEARKATLRYEYHTEDIEVEHNSVSIKLLQDSKGHHYYSIDGNLPIPIARYPNFKVTCEEGTQITCLQQSSADTTFELTENYLEVQYEDESTVYLNVPYDSDEIYKLELLMVDRDYYSSYLYIPYPETLHSRDIFEKAGEAFGQVVLSMPK